MANDDDVDVVVRFIDQQQASMENTLLQQIGVMVQFYDEHGSLQAMSQETS